VLKDSIAGNAQKNSRNYLRVVAEFATVLASRPTTPSLQDLLGRECNPPSTVDDPAAIISAVDSAHPAFV
jgi:hypothetical protein